MEQNHNTERIEMLLDNKNFYLAKFITQKFNLGFTVEQQNLKLIFEYCLGKYVETNDYDYCVNALHVGQCIHGGGKKPLFTKLFNHCYENNTVNHSILIILAEEAEDISKSVWEKILTQAVKAQDLSESLKILKRYLKRDFQKNELEEIFKQYNDEKIFKDMVHTFTRGHCGAVCDIHDGNDTCCCGIDVFSQAELPYILTKCINEGWVQMAGIVSLKLRSEKYHNEEILAIEKENIPPNESLLEKQEIQDFFEVLVVGEKGAFFNFVRLFYSNPNEETRKWLVLKSLERGVVFRAKQFVRGRDKKFADYLDSETLSNIYQTYLKEGLLVAALEYFEETRDHSEDFLAIHGLPLPKIERKDLEEIYTNALKKGDWKTARAVVVKLNPQYENGLPKIKYQEIFFALIDNKFFKEAEEVRNILSQYPFS